MQATNDTRTAIASQSCGAVLATAYGVCEATVRQGDKDRWLATLFAPADRRPHLHALYAFNFEIARVREVVSDPLPGEVRYQWWRDALEGEAGGNVEAHPVAAALLDTIARFCLPSSAFTDLIAAREFDLYNDPMPTLADLEGYCGETSSSVVRLATLILDDGAASADAAGHAGVAYAITGLLHAFPWHAARGQMYLPGDLLARHATTVDAALARRDRGALLAALADMRACAREHLRALRIGAIAPGEAAAFLPVSLVEATLGQMEKPGYDPYTTDVELPQWRKQWAMWRAARRIAAGNTPF